MPRVSPRGPGYSPNALDPFVPDSGREGMKSYTSSATGSPSPDNMHTPPRAIRDRASSNSPRSNGASMHTRTNFGKTRGYVPPVVPPSPSRYPNQDTPTEIRSSRSSSAPPVTRSSNPFDEDVGPEDEIMPVVRSLRPTKQGSSEFRPERSGRSRRSKDESMKSKPRRARPESYISETDDSCAQEYNDIPFEPRIREASQEPYMARTVEPVKVKSPREPEDLYTGRSKDSSERRRRRKHKKQSSKGNASDPTMDDPMIPVVTPKKLSRGLARPSSPALYDEPEWADTPVDETPSAVASAGPDPSYDRWDEEEAKWRESAATEMEYHSSEEESNLDGQRSPESRYEEFVTRKAGVVPLGENPVKSTTPVSILRSKAASSGGTDDEDSLFDFVANESRRASQSGIGMRKSALKTSNSGKSRGRRSKRMTTENEPDDEESLQDYGVIRRRSSSLQERTQQAWASRNQRSHSTSSEAPRTEGVVQFGDTDTIHHFDDQATQMTTGTSRSMNSMYTKSPESEAEDLIKDLFFIGSGVASNPGRRKIKYQPEYKRTMARGADEITVDDTTLGTTDDVTLNTLDYTADDTAYTSYTGGTPYTEETAYTDDLSVETSPRKSEVTSKACSPPENSTKGPKDGDPLAFVWDFFEGGISAMGTALGLTATAVEIEAEKTEKPSKNSEVQAASKEKESPAMKMPAITKQKEVAPIKDGSLKEMLTKQDKSSSEDTEEIDETPEEKGSFNNMMDYLFGDPESEKRLKKLDDQKSVATSTTPLEEDPRLEELALYAVRSKHQLYNMVFDETVSIDIPNDINFTYVKTSLPLGILFHENDGGCWITKVFPDGNAAKAGGVKVGDQLAAINGASAIKLKVDEICALITDAPNTESIELTFLRYTGKLYPVPGTKIENSEGYEVSPPSSPKKSPFKALRPKLRKNSAELAADSMNSREVISLKSPKAENSVKVDKSLKTVQKAQQPLREEAKAPKRRKWFGLGKKS